MHKVFANVRPDTRLSLVWTCYIYNYCCCFLLPVLWMDKVVYKITVKCQKLQSSNVYHNTYCMPVKLPQILTSSL